MIGPSGSGKSTLLHLAGALDRPTAGTVRIAGHDVGALSDRKLSALRATVIGFVFQHRHVADRRPRRDLPGRPGCPRLSYGGLVVLTRRAVYGVGHGSRKTSSVLSARSCVRCMPRTLYRTSTLSKPRPPHGS